MDTDPMAMEDDMAGRDMVAVKAKKAGDMIRNPARVEEQVRTKAAAMVRVGVKKAESGVLDHKYPFTIK